jgi:hypothetical protein
MAGAKSVQRELLGRGAVGIHQQRRHALIAQLILETWASSSTGYSLVGEEASLNVSPVRWSTFSPACIRSNFSFQYSSHFGENNLELKAVRRCSVPGLAGIACRLYLRLKNL